MAFSARILTVFGICLLAATVCLVHPGAAFSKDPYKVLGISKDADEASIKRAYKKLALKYHPDKNPKGQSKFIEVQQAYEILSDASKKREFDLGGGHDGYHHHDHHQGSGSSRHEHHHRFGNFHFHYHYQQQQQYQQQQAYQQQQEQMYNRALPSNTSFLTMSNFRTLVFYGGRPWLVMVYLEDSAPCREFSATWEALWRSLGGSQAGGGSRDGASVGLGRIHARFQRSLVNWILKSSGLLQGGSLPESELPVLFGVPNGCMEASCFLRYRGPMRLSAIQDFVADRLLNLPRVPQLEPVGLPAFLRRASPYKVVVVAFGRGGGSGSLALRTLAARQKDMLTIVRGHVQERDAASGAEWQRILGLSSPPASGTVVFLRGPGTAPRLLTVPPGKTSDMQQQIDEQGLLWQEVPPLRPATGSSLGCLWGRDAAASGRSMIDTCVIAVAPRGAQLDEARRRMALLGRYLAVQGGPGGQRDPLVSGAATAYMAGKLRLAWLDATAQQHLCAWMLGTPEAMRPASNVPPPGTNAAGRAAAAAQANAAAAAKSPQLVQAICGPGPLDVLGRARNAAAAAATAARLPRLAARLRPPPAAHLVVFRPALDSSSWFRGGSASTRHGRPVFLYSVNADYDLASPDRSADVDLPKLAGWINQMHQDPDRHLHASKHFPPGLRPDDEPGALEYVAGRVRDGVMKLYHAVMSVAGAATDGSGDTQQLVNVAVAVVALVLLQLVLWRRGDDAPEQRNGSPADGRRTAAPLQPRGRPTSGCGSRGRRSRSQDDDDTPGRSGGGAERRSGASPAPVNRRATSPSWREGHRGDARVSDDDAAGDREPAGATHDNDDATGNSGAAVGSDPEANRCSPEPSAGDGDSAGAVHEAGVQDELRNGHWRKGAEVHSDKMEAEVQGGAHLQGTSATEGAEGEHSTPAGASGFAAGPPANEVPRTSTGHTTPTAPPNAVDAPVGPETQDVGDDWQQVER